MNPTQRRKEDPMGTMKFRRIVAAGLLLFVGCATTKPAQQVYQPAFQFTPPATAAPGSAGVAFAVINARFSKDEGWTKEQPFVTFSRNLSADFQEILNARGYTVRGPFGSADEMTFPDKKGSDLALQPTLELTVASVSRGVEEKVNLLSANSYIATFDVTVDGRVTLAVTEPLSGERMWFKSVVVPSTTVQYAVPVASQTPAGVAIDLSTNPDLGRALDQAYLNIMDAAWKYLDPGEMALVKKQGDEIRAKKVY